MRRLIAVLTAAAATAVLAAPATASADTTVCAYKGQYCVELIIFDEPIRALRDRIEDIVITIVRP